MNKVLCCFIILIFSTISFSQGLNKPDLNKLVTINVDGSRMSDVCDYLSQQTGIKIQAGENDDDWAVYDRKAVIFVNKVPLKDLMLSMANVFDFTWKQDGNGTIILTSTEEQKDNEFNLRKEYFKTVENLFAEKQQNALNSIINKSSISNQYADLLYKSAYCDNLIVFINKFPTVKTHLLNKTSVKIPFSTLNNEEKEIIKSLASSYINFNEKLQPDIKDKLSILSNDQNLQLLINGNAKVEDEDIEDDSIFCRITIKNDKNALEMVILDPNGKYSNIIAGALISLNQGKKLEDITKSLTMDLLKFKMELAFKESTNINILSDQIFSNKINLYELTQKEKITYNEFYGVINKEVGVNIVADSFYRKSYELDKKQESLSNSISNFCNFYGITPKYKNNILEMQDKRYYIKIAGDIPSVWLDFWSERANLNRGYSLDELIAMSNLNDIQIDNEIAYSPRLNKTENKVKIDTMEVIYKRNLLRFLGSLSNEQTNKLTDTKLSAYEINDMQWDLLQKALEDYDIFYIKQEKNSQIIKLTREVANVIEYTLEYNTDLSTQPITITILTNQFTIRNNNNK